MTVIAKKIGAGNSWDPTIGAGGGTLVVAIAHSLPSDSIWHPILLYSAPSVAVISAIVISWLKRRLVTALDEADVKKLADSAKATIDNIVNRENISPDHKNIWRIRSSSLKEYLYLKV